MQAERDLGPTLFPSIEELFPGWFDPEPFTDPEADVAEAVKCGLYHGTEMAHDLWDASEDTDYGQWECNCWSCTQMEELLHS